MKDKPHRFFYGYIIVAAGFLIMTIMWGTYYSFGIFFEPVLKEFGWTRAATSGAFSLSLVLTGFFAIVMGRLNDRFGPRKVITACALLLGAGYILMSQISALWELYLFYGLILGIGLGGAFVPVASTISRWFIRRRSLMTGITASGIGVGTLFMPPISNWLISSYGWRTSYIIIGAVAAVLIIIAAQFLRRDPEKMGLKPYGENEVGQENSGLRVAGFSMHEAISTRQYWICIVALFCAWFSICTIIAHIVIYAIGLKIPSASAANILAILGVGGILGRIIMGGAGDRIGNRAAISTSFVLMTLALLWLLIAKEAWMLYLFSILFGFAYGAVSTLESPMIAELFGLGSHGLIFGVIFFSDSVGGAIGVVLAGRIFDIIGSYQPAFLTCVVLSVVSIILFLFLRPISKARLED